MKRIIFCLALFLTSLLSAQIKFEKGYIITPNGDKKDVLIKNIDWLNSPEEFVFKNDENSPQQNGNLNNIIEFGIYGYNSYINYNGLINTSSTDISSLSFKKEPELKKMKVFLKQLVSGNKKLYSYKNNNILNYFYSDANNNDHIELLIYKKYHPDGDNMLMATNEEYKEQLSILFSDNEIAKKNTSFAKYNDKDLIKVFGGVKQSNNLTISEQEGNAIRKGKFNLNVRPGFNFYSESKILNFMDDQPLPSTSNFRIGIEAEILLPFNKNKWSIIIEPNYAIYKSKNTKTSISNESYNHQVLSFEKYAFLDIPVGVRHYMYLNDKSKFFVNAQISVMRAKMSKSKTIDIQDGEYTVLTADLNNSIPFNSFAFGGGYNYNNKYTLELRYNTSGEILKQMNNRSALLQYFSIILGYNLF